MQETRIPALLRSKRIKLRQGADFRMYLYDSLGPCAMLRGSDLYYFVRNALANVFFVAGIATFIPSSLASDPWITNWLWDRFGHAASVDMEPGGEWQWWKNMWGSLFK